MVANTCPPLQGMGGVWTERCRVGNPEITTSSSKLGKMKEASALAETQPPVESAFSSVIKSQIVSSAGHFSSSCQWPLFVWTCAIAVGSSPISLR